MDKPGKASVEAIAKIALEDSTCNASTRALPSRTILPAVTEINGAAPYSRYDVDLIAMTSILCASP